jgi:hypothetical protein
LTGGAPNPNICGNACVTINKNAPTPSAAATTSLFLASGMNAAIQCRMLGDVLGSTPVANPVRTLSRNESGAGGAFH